MNVDLDQLRQRNTFSLRDALYSQIQQTIPEIQSLHENDKLGILLGEGPASSLVAHRIYKCHSLRSKE